MNYDAAYFIKKLKAIPEEYWCTDLFRTASGECCALGHCGAKESAKDTIEANALYDLFEKHGINVVEVNDGKQRKGKRYVGKTPKVRVLLALSDIESGKI
jgi:hypothetical protein